MSSEITSSQATTHQATTRRVLLIGSGGTIASTRDGGSASAASVTADSLMQQIPETCGAKVTAVGEFARINSWAFMQDDMLRLARFVCAAAEDAEIDGIVVTHGTDTIERSAFLTDLLYTGDKPVVFVGAMRSADHADPDGPGNLARALEAIGAGVLDGVGATVLVGPDVHSARSVTKIESRHPGAVVSPDFGPVAVCDAAAQWTRAGEPFERFTITLPQGVELPAVPVLVTLSAPVPDLVRFVLDATDGRALVAEGLGSGNVPPPFARELEAAAAAGVLVALTTSALSSGVHPSYRGDGGGADLIEAGAHGARFLNSAKTSLLLAALLAESDANPNPNVNSGADLADRFTAALDVLFPLTP